MTAIIIPAHNEEHGIVRLLEALDPAALGAEVVVVANGCTDRTAELARAAGVTVIETPIPSKIKALELGDGAVSSFPRLYIDGDVEIGASDVRKLVDAVQSPAIHAAGPTRRIPMTGVSRPVRMYYRVWQQLDGVREELFGRGVIAVDEIGHERISDWGDRMSDDLYIALSFAPGERTVVPDAFVTIWPPKTYADLLHRRVRAMHGNLAIAGQAAAGSVRKAPGSGRSLVRLAVTRPRELPAIALFAATAVLAKVRGRLNAARGRTQWLRDESSRSAT